MDLCVTDPPYNVAYEGGSDENGERMTIINDSMDDYHFYQFLLAAYKQMLRVLKPGGSYYIFHADSEGLNFRAALKEAGGIVKQNLIWVKNSLVLGRQDYQWKHEPCLYGWKEGGSHYFCADRSQTTVLEHRPDLSGMDREHLINTAEMLMDALDQANTSILHADKPSRNDIHPTMKPVNLVQRMVQNSSRRGENVLDLFGGSGTTMIACEQCGRTAFIMELDTKYCDAAIQRWEDATGEKAVLLVE